MKRFRQIMALTLCAVFLMSVTALACWVFDSAEEIGGTAELSSEQAQEIMADFAEEIAYLEEKYEVQLNDIDAVLELAKTEAADRIIREMEDPFGPLVNTIVLAECKIETELLNEAAVAGPLGSERPTITRHEPEWVRPYGILNGGILQYAAAGTTIDLSYTITLSRSSGDAMEDLSGSGVDVPKQITFTLQGPEYMSFLSNGKRATHRAAMGVLYGTVMKRDYEVYHPDTGYTFEGTEYFVREGSGKIRCYTFDVCLGFPTFSEQVTGSDILEFANNLEFEEAVEANPKAFI